MNRTERRLFNRTMQVGIVLTLLVIVVDYFGLLQPLERYLYDLRARHCQFFTPPPTDKVVHIDIDDPSLQAIGWFPWPRTKMALMLDEIRLAGAKVIGMDIIFPEAQDPRIEKNPDGSYRTILDDEVFAESIRAAGNVLLPVSTLLEERGAHPPMFAAIVEVLSADLESDPTEVASKLRGTKFDSPDLLQTVKQWFYEARDRAAFAKVEEMVQQGVTDLDQIAAKLTPRAFAASSKTDARLLLMPTLSRVIAVRRIMEFTLPVVPGLPPTLTAKTEVATIAPLVSASRWCGSAEFVRDNDGIVRSVPLYVNYRGRLMPHMALVCACAVLDVPMSEVKLAANSVTIPIPDGPPIVIPVRQLNSRTFGKVGMFMDLPWFGKADKDSWLTMYDAPSFTEARQHVQLRTIWAICETEQDVQKNNLAAIDAIAFFIDRMESDPAKVREFVRAAPSLSPEAIEQKIRQTLENTDVKDTLKPIREMPAHERGDDGNAFVNSYVALESVLARNARLREQHAAMRLQLRQKLSGRYCLIGWTATGKTDFYPTSMHATCPGAVIQTVVFNAISTRHFWTRSTWLTGALITFFLGVATSTAVALLPTWRALFLSGLMVLGYLAVNGIVFYDYSNRVVNAAAPVTASTVIWFAVTVARYIYEQRERGRITKRFSSYVDPALVNMYVDDPEAAGFGGKVKEITVVFTDLAGFTTLSEKLRERTVPLLNEYMSLMLPIIRQNRGYWNKFLGDGIMFFYNAPADNPKHAQDAVITVLQMQKAMEHFNQKLFTRGLPHVAMRAGIATGVMVVGDAGSTDPEHGASDYTVLGDEANLGARLEGANKALGSRILMSQRTAEQLQNGILIRPMGVLQVVGKTEGVMTYEALCLSEEATDKQRTLVELSTEVVEKFRVAYFEACIAAARKLEDACGSSKFSQLYIRLSKEYLIQPPEKFNGEIVLEQK